MISVIVPVYNTSYYLSRCVQSILNQTCSEWELILVDDGSTDNSGEVCEQFKEQFPQKVRVFHQKNAGASIARKNGISEAKGDFLMFVDGDDYVERDYMERLLHAMTRYNSKIVSCDPLCHPEDTEVHVDRTANTMLLDERSLYKRFFGYQFWGFWGKLYHRSVFDDLYFPKYTINEDYVVMAQLFERYKQMVYVPIGLYHYVSHEDSLSHQKLSVRMFDEYYNKLWVRDFYTKNNPHYVRNAEAQLTETCIKLIRTVQQEDVNGVFCDYEDAMRHFLKSQIVSILFNPFLRNGLKFLALRYC